MKLFLIVIPILLTGCGKHWYTVQISKEQKCQNVINKGIEHKICKDQFFYECRHYSNVLKVFKKLQNANNYCEQLRNKNDVQTKISKTN